MRYELLGFDLSKHSSGQWMWNKNRASRAVENYRNYLEATKDSGESLDDYWRKTGGELEFIMREGDGISSVKYWIPPRSHVMADNNWLDIRGYANKWGFKTENSEALIKRIVESLTDERDMVLDYFAGSGTTLAVSQKMNRKWIGVEMGEHFDSVILPRMKKVLSRDKSGVSKELDAYDGGGFFKYCGMEQYEETLQNARYDDGEQLELDSAKSPFEQYVFFSDDKFAHVVELLQEDGLSIGLDGLYNDIDIPESISIVARQAIKRITEDSVVLADGSAVKTDPAKMTVDEQRRFVSLIKPYLWWGEARQVKHS